MCSIDQLLLSDSPLWWAYTILQEKYFRSLQTFNLPECVLINGEENLFSLSLFNLFPSSPLVVSQFNAFFMKVYSGFLSPEAVPAFLRQASWATRISQHNVLPISSLLERNSLLPSCLPHFLFCAFILLLCFLSLGSSLYETMVC